MYKSRHYRLRDTFSADTPTFFPCRMRVVARYMRCMRPDLHKMEEVGKVPPQPPTYFLFIFLGFLFLFDRTNETISIAQKHDTSNLLPRSDRNSLSRTHAAPSLPKHQYQY